MTLSILNLFKCFIALVALVITSVQASEHQGIETRLEIPSSFNPVGSGARALGWGGAFIAVADDATAASWNPSGLIQLRNPEIAVVGNYINRTEDNNFGTNPEASGKQNIDNANVNYLSASMPCAATNCGKNMVFSINYQNLYNMDRQWDINFSDYQTFPAGYDSSEQNINMKQSGDLYAIGLAYAIQATESLSLGFTLNFWENIMGKNEWTQSYNSFESSNSFDGFFDFQSTSQTKITEKFKFSGFNVNLGLLWNVYEQEEQKLMLGVVLKTPFTADISHSKSVTRSESIDNETPIDSSVSNNYLEKMDMPMSYGFGLSYQYSDAMTFAGDVYRTSWNNFKYTDYKGNQFSPISNKTVSQSNVDATYQVRLGAEYRIISQEFGKNYIIPIRAGLFYDPAPAENKPDNYFGFSLGTGIAYKTFVFDIAYQYRFGNNVNTQFLENRDFSQDVQDHSLYGSLFIRF